MFVLSVDVDHFKSINDAHGHAVGDSLLTEVAARIQSCVRDYDTLARLGGDEFVLLVRGIELDEGVGPLARRILMATDRPCLLAGHVLRPTLSIGIAEYPRSGLTKDALMRASDNALYAAKRAGRNRFCIAATEGSY